jgi:threonine aldolase
LVTSFATERSEVDEFIADIRSFVMA